MQEKAPISSLPHKEAIQYQNLLGKININDLSRGDTVEVMTKNSKYIIHIVELTEKSHLLEVTSNNPKYGAPLKNAFLVGTTIFPGSSIISPRSFAVGGLMEIVYDHPDKPGNKRQIITSPVQTIHINGVQILPLPEKTN